MKPNWYDTDGLGLCEAHAPDVEGDLSEHAVDTPVNCKVCDRPCNYTLTAAGVQYVLDKVWEALGRPAAERDRVCAAPSYPPGNYYHGRRHVEIVRDWAADLKSYGLTDGEELLVKNFLTLTKESETHG